MKKIILSLYVFSFVSSFAQQAEFPQFEWVKPGHENLASQVEVSNYISDDQGNTYAIGSFQGTIQLDSTHTLTCDKGKDIFILKFNDQKELLWSAQANGPGWKFPGRLVPTSDGGVIVAGYFFTSLQLGSFHLTQLGVTHPQYVAKLDANGNWQWATLAGTGNIGAVVEDNQANLYISGQLLKDGHFEPVLPNVERSSDTYIGKMDKDGNWLWVKTFGSDDDAVYSTTYPAAIHLMGNKMYLNGSFLRNTDITGDEQHPNHFQTDNQTTYIALMDTSGNWEWATYVAGDLGFGLTYSMTDDANSIYLLGTFVNELWLGSETIKVGCRHASMLMKYNEKGELAWYKLISSPQHKSDIWGGPMNYGGNIFGVGSINFSGHVNLNHHDYTSHGQENGYQDFLVFSFDTSGTISWTKQLMAKNHAKLFGLQTLNDSSYLLTGQVSGDTYFDNDLLEYNNENYFNFQAKLTLGSQPLRLIPRGPNTQFAAYPNPVINSFTLNAPLGKHAKVTLYSVQGIACAEWLGNHWTTYELPENLQSGIYYLEIQSDFDKQTIRIQH